MHGGVGTAYYADSGYPAAHSYGHNNYHGAGQSIPKNKKRPSNSGSRFLTDDENALLFSMLGNDCISLAAGICQLYRADNGHWTRVVTGVIALVKDYNRRAYVLRMYNLDTQTLSWEQILYRLFQANYYPSVPRFLSFEGDQAVYGLSFAEELEATDFGFHLKKRYEAEQKSSRSVYIGVYFMYFSSTTSLASPITSPQRHHHHQNITSDSPLYFYDSHLTQNSSGQQSRNLYLSRSDSRRPFIQSTQYSSPVQGDNDYNNRLYDNVPQSRIPPLARNRSFSGSSASLYEADDLLRPIAEVKPFPVYSTTEQAVASAEQRLYDAVTTLNRRRAAGAYSSYSTPMNVRRNSVSSLQPTMFSNGVGSSPGIIRPKPICGYSPAVSRSASVQHGNQTPILAHSNHYYPSSGVTVGRRSYFPVYRNDTDFRTQATDAFTRRTTSKPSVHEIPVRCDQTPIARSSYPTPEAVYATTTRVRSRQSPGYPNDGYSSPGFTVLKRPSHYAVSNGLASMQFNSSDHSANKAVDGLKWTQPANNQLRFDDSPRPPPSRMEGQKQCLSCTLKGVTCPGVRHSDLRYEHPRMHSQQLPRRHVSRSSPPTTRGLPIPKKPFPTELNLHGKPREPPSYDAFYQSNAYSSSSSAYSSGSSPPEPVDSSVVSADSPLSVSFPAMSTSAFVPPVPKVNKVPPRPGHKPRPMPQATIAAVSPNNVSTVSVSEDPASALPPRASSAIPFESASTKATPKKYSTLRPGRPTVPPPPPPANTKPKLPAVPDHATADRRPEVARPQAVTSSTTRPLLISRPSLTSQCSFDGADSRKFSGSHPIKSHESNRNKRESLMEQTSSMLQTDSPFMARASMNKNSKPSTSSVNPPQSHEVSNNNPPRKPDFSTPLTIDTTSYQCTSSEDQMDSPSSILKTTSSDPMSDVSTSPRSKFVAFPDQLHTSLDSGCPAPLASYYSASDVSVASSRRSRRAVAKHFDEVSKQQIEKPRQPSKEGSITSKVLPELPQEKPHRPSSTRELSPVTLLHDGPPLWSLPVGERDPYAGNSVAHFPYIPREIPTPPGGIIIQSVNRVKYEDIRRRAAMYPKPVPTPPPVIIGAEDTPNRRLSITKPELPPKPENILADDSNSLPKRRSSGIKPEPPPKPAYVRVADSKNASTRRPSILEPIPEPKPVDVQAEDKKNSPIRRPSILRPISEPVPKLVESPADDFSNVSECLKTTLKPDRPLKPAPESKRNSAYEPIAVLAYNIQNVSECRRSALLPPHLLKSDSDLKEPSPATIVAQDDQEELEQSTSECEHAEAYQVRSYDSRGVSECPLDVPHHKNFRFMKMTASQMLLKLKSGKIHKKSIFSSNKSYSLCFADTLETDKTHLAGSSAAPRPHRGYDTGITASGAVTHVPSTAVRRVDDKKEKKRKKEKKKLRKEDIGIPTNFQHKAHIGWDQDGGFNQQVFGDEPMDDSVRDLLRAAGHNPDNLKPDEIKFVYNFIENYNKSGKNAEPLVTTHSVPLPPTNNSRTLAVNGRLTGQRPLPATPSLHSSNPLPAIPRHEHVPARPPPPPPPAFQQPYHAQPPPPPPPPVTPSNRTASLSSSHAPAPVSSSAPPPPPPPPPVSKALKPSGNAAPPPPPPPPPPNFLNGGGASTNGASEHKTEAAPKPPAPAANGARSNLLAEIQAGKNLKRVGPPPEKSIGKVVGGSTRDNMMEEIRQGANLKHVDQNAVAERRKSVSVQNLDGIAGALARALESRRNRMNQSDSEDEEANDSEWEDD
uniref:WH1 domain-containing protein n=1 Tax=Panagrellus redivivus TaxID=6233 RepID=A0A7E4V320_PANRE